MRTIGGWESADGRESDDGESVLMEDIWLESKGR